MKIEDFDFKAHLHQPLWVVYGSTGWPQMVCLAAKEYRHVGVNDNKPYICVWGYSVYKRVPGFRTMGSQPEKFFTGNNAHIFTDIDEALAEMKARVTPKQKAIDELEKWKYR